MVRDYLYYRNLEIVNEEKYKYKFKNWEMELFLIKIIWLKSRT